MAQLDGDSVPATESVSLTDVEDAGVKPADGSEVPEMDSSIRNQTSESKISEINEENVKKFKEEIHRLQNELDEARSLVAVANYSLEESLETERRKCKEEVATLQQLMKESIEEATQRTKDQCESEIRRLRNQVTRLELEIQEMKAGDRDNPNVFSAVTKSLARKVGSLANPALTLSPISMNTSTSHSQQQDTGSDDYLEQSMKRAQEDAEMLKSLVLPLEEEIKALKDKLRSTDEQLRIYESSQDELVRGTRLLARLAEEQSLSTAIMQLMDKYNSTCDDGSQSNHLQLFVAILNSERASLREERERLRLQLQEVCQLLENERRKYRDLRRACRRADELQLMHSNSMSQENHRDSFGEKSSAKGHPIKDKLNLSPLFSRISPVLKRRSPAHSPQRESTQDPSNTSAVAASEETESKLGSFDGATDEVLTVETGKDGSLALSDSFVGQSNASWVDRPCEHCAQTETEVQQLKTEKLLLEKQLCKAREEVDRMSELIKDMERKWTEVAKDYEKQVTMLYGSIEDLQGKLKATHASFSKFRNEAQDTLRKMKFDREAVSSELVRLQEDNDFLVGKHSAHAEQLQNEIINLPDNLQDLQYAVLNLREDLIAAKVAKETIEKRMKSEVQHLKNQLAAEKQAKEGVENSMTIEIDDLREQVGLMRSVHTQLDEENKRNASLEAALQEARTQLAEAQERIEEATVFKSKTDAELQHLRNRVASLQADLETSEAVQRDFVQLSQQLQVQLEKIRQSEKELRWQYEEDVNQCAECRLLFTVTRRKHHCRHCGQIFCNECLRKTVTSGPNKRQARVCNVCYYLLVQDSAPFFSSEPQANTN